MHPRYGTFGNWALAIISLLLTSPCACRSRSPEPSDARTPDPAATVAAAPAQATPSAEAIDCQGFSDGKKLFQVDNDDLEEASDIAISAKNPGVYWSHNDGGPPRIFAFSNNGHDLGTYQIEGADLEDWEDMALGPGPNEKKSYLYVGDIGANKKARDRITIYRMEEPDVDLVQKAKKRKIDRVRRFGFAFPDRKSRDCESLMIDPRSADLYIVTKPRHGAPVVYRAKAPLDAKQTTILEEVATLSSISAGPHAPTLVTSGDISVDGSMILLRTYDRAYLWRRGKDETIDVAFSRPPCRVPLEKEAQGEAIAFAPDGSGYYSVSEGRHPKVYFYARKQ